MNKWYTIAVIEPNYYDAKTDIEESLELGNNIYFKKIPDWLKEEDLIGHLSANDKEFLTTRAKYVFVSEYEASGLGKTQEKILTDISICNLILWLTKPSALAFRLFFHIGEESGNRFFAQSFSTSHLRSHTDYANESLENQDFVEALYLNKKVNEINRESPLWISLITLWGALTASNWEIRYLWLWIALEALFGAPAELTFRISLRISFFLLSKQEERKKLFDIIKKSYSYRSALVHGMKLNKIPHRESKDILYNLEDVVRRSLMKIFKDDNLMQIFSDNERREKFLDDLIFL